MRRTYKFLMHSRAGRQKEIRIDKRILEAYLYIVKLSVAGKKGGKHGS